MADSILISAKWLMGKWVGELFTDTSYSRAVGGHSCFFVMVKIFFLIATRGKQLFAGWFIFRPHWVSTQPTAQARSTADDTCSNERQQCWCRRGWTNSQCSSGLSNSLLVVFIVSLLGSWWLRGDDKLFQMLVIFFLLCFVHIPRLPSSARIPSPYLIFAIISIPIASLGFWFFILR